MGILRLPPSQRPLHLLRNIEESPWTRNWDHLLPLHWGIYKKRTKIEKNIPAPVPVKDRIRQWNIVPGDRIRVHGDGEGSIREVFGINRVRNLVYLKTRHHEESKDDSRPTQPSVPYSRCQLYIGDREFPPLPGEDKPLVAPVFASRIGCTAPNFEPRLGRFDWERFAVQTIPRLSDQGEKVRISIPWPKTAKPHTPPSKYDTPADVVKEVTWRPSLRFYPPSNRAKAKLVEDAYLHSIRPPPSSVPVLEYNQNTAPIEYMLGHELSNPHSRVKKQRRSRNWMKERAEAHKLFIETELSNLDGRTRIEALAEAEWKWTELRRNEERERRKKLWVLRGGARRLQRKRLRRARKERKEMEKMRNLVLAPAPNQVLPGTQPTAEQ
ncbi:hypothetical protein K439DRAFT_1648585 [Ramaria rubella]|nr:hypothetical protein K439DRAFT_1648585 [Ramaria rubella]